MGSGKEEKQKNLPGEQPLHWTIRQMKGKCEPYETEIRHLYLDTYISTQEISDALGGNFSRVEILNYLKRENIYQPRGTEHWKR